MNNTGSGRRKRSFGKNVLSDVTTFNLTLVPAVDEWLEDAVDFIKTCSPPVSPSQSPMGSPLGPSPLQSPNTGYAPKKVNLIHIEAIANEFRRQQREADLVGETEAERVSRQLYTPNSFLLKRGQAHSSSAVGRYMYEQVIAVDRHKGVVMRIPEDAARVEHLSPGLLQFCFPDGGDSAAPSGSGWVFTLHQNTGDPTEKYYCCCVSTGGGVVHVLISRFAYLEPHFQVLRAAIEARESYAELLGQYRALVPQMHQALQVGPLAPARVNQWRRVYHINEEEHCLVDSVLKEAFVATFLGRGLDFGFALLSNIVLERSVVIRSSCLQTTSFTVLGFALLLRPFHYQGVFLPMLPHSMNDIIDAPVPFVLGVPPSFDPSTLDSTVKFVDLDERNAAPLECLALPRLQQLHKEIRPEMLLLRSFSSRPEFEGSATKAVQRVASTIYSFWQDLLSPMRMFLFRDLSEFENPVSVFMQDAFIDAQSQSQEDELFLAAFFTTQMWCTYSERTRMEFDLSHSRARISSAPGSLTSMGRPLAEKPRIHY